MIFFRNIKNYHPANFLTFVFIGLVLWMKVFISKDTPGVYYDPDPMPIYNWIYNYLTEFTLLSKIIAFILVLFQGIIINGVTNQYNLLGFRSYLPGIFFITISANIPEHQTFHPVLIANILFLAAWERISSITEKSNTFKAYFNAAFYVSLAALFYPNYLFLILVVLISTSLNRVSKPREFIMLIFGFVTVWYFYFTINYLLYNELLLNGIELSYSFASAPFEHFKFGQIIFFIYLIALIVLASFQASTFVSNLKIQIRRNLKILFIWFTISALVFLFTPSSTELIYTSAIPVSFLIAIFMANLRSKWFPEVIWVLFFGVTIINQYFPNLLAN